MVTASTLLIPFSMVAVKSDGKNAKREYALRIFVCDQMNSKRNERENARKTETKREWRELSEWLFAP